MATLAIICPAKDAGKTLPALAESFLAQDNPDLAALHIMVADADDPEIPVIEDLVKANPDKIFLHVVPNCDGADELRKKGIQVTDEPYVGFADADDSLSPDFASTIVSALEKGADAVDCSFYVDRLGKKKPETNGFRKKDAILDRYQALKWLCWDAYIRGFLWCKGFRREVVSEFGLHFAKGMMFEDIPMVFEAFSRCGRIAYLNKPIYHYCIRGDSSIHQGNAKRAEQRLRSYLALYYLIQRMGDQKIAEIYRRAYPRMWSNMLYDISLSEKAGLPRKEGQNLKRILKAVIKGKGGVDESDPNIVAAKGMLKRADGK